MILRRAQVQAAIGAEITAARLAVLFARTKTTGTATVLVTARQLAASGVCQAAALQMAGAQTRPARRARQARCGTATQKVSAETLAANGAIHTAQAPRVRQPAATAYARAATARQRIIARLTAAQHVRQRTILCAAQIRGPMATNARQKQRVFL